MTCDRIQLPTGGVAIVCSRGRRPRPKCACGKPSSLLCDWKVKGGTCDAPICVSCAEHVGNDKDLCPTHREAYAAWRAAKGADA